MDMIAREERSGEKLPTLNLPLLRKVLDHIDAHPEEWNQRYWGTGTACGTAFCIAGHAAVMVGETFDPKTSAWSCGTSGVEKVAREALGLTEAETGSGGGTEGLFHYFNTREDVQRHAEAIAARAGERL